MLRIHAAIECLQRLSDAFGERRRQLASSVGLTEHQWGVLEEVSSEHFMPSMFARQRESSPAAVSKTLRQLIDKDLVRVTVRPNDGRQRKYQLSKRGEHVMNQLREERANAIAAIWMSFDDEQLRTFTDFGNRLTDTLEQYGQQGSKKEAHG
jgi:DNA-binding MarR family transcriptional regulator